MSSTFQMTMLVPATLFTLLWIWLAVRYEKKFASITDTLKKSEYPLHELFYIGFELLELVSSSRGDFTASFFIYGHPFNNY